MKATVLSVILAVPICMMPPPNLLLLPLTVVFSSVRFSVFWIPPP